MYPPIVYLYNLVEKTLSKSSSFTIVKPYSLRIRVYIVYLYNLIKNLIWTELTLIARSDLSTTQTFRFLGHWLRAKTGVFSYELPFNSISTLSYLYKIRENSCFLFPLGIAALRNYYWRRQTSWIFVSFSHNSSCRTPHSTKRPKPGKKPQTNSQTSSRGVFKHLKSGFKML